MPKNKFVVKIDTNFVGRMLNNAKLLLQDFNFPFCCLNKTRIYSVLPPPPVFFWPPVTNYVLLYSTLLCKNNARAPGGHKKYIPTKLGGGETE